MIADLSGRAVEGVRPGAARLLRLLFRIPPGSGYLFRVLCIVR